MPFLLSQPRELEAVFLRGEHAGRVKVGCIRKLSDRAQLKTRSIITIFYFSLSFWVPLLSSGEKIVSFLSLMFFYFQFSCLESVLCLFLKPSFNLDQLLSRPTTTTLENLLNVSLGIFSISCITQLLSSNLSLFCGNTFWNNFLWKDAWINILSAFILKFKYD